MNDPGKSCTAVSGQRDKLGPVAGWGCIADQWVHPTSLHPSEQLARLDLVPFISLSGTRQNKKDGRREEHNQPEGGGRMVMGEGPCSHHIHKELTGVSHGHAEGLSAGGQFGRQEARPAARRGSRGPMAAGGGSIINMGARREGHPRAVAWVRVMAAQAAGQRVVAAVAMLAAAGPRALAGRSRPPQAAAGRVVRSLPPGRVRPWGPSPSAGRCHYD